MRHTYICRMRPPTPGAIPWGAVEVHDTETPVYGNHGTVTYLRRLTKDEIKDYELEEVQNGKNISR